MLLCEYELLWCCFEVGCMAGAATLSRATAKETFSACQMACSLQALGGVLRGGPDMLQHLAS